MQLPFLDNVNLQYHVELEDLAMDGIVRHLVLISIVLLVPGCKLAVMVSSEGNVLSSSETRHCNGPGYCEFDIVESSFSDTFTAVPRPGFEFVRWQDGNGFLCADATDPVCTVEMPNDTVGAAIVALFNTGSIRPVFSNPGGVDTDDDGTINELDADDDNDGLPDSSDDCPLDGPDLNGLGCPTIPDEETVLVGDRLWVQPNLFPDLSWHDINAACPASTGTCSGKIGDIDVSGWTWASGDEVSDLINTFMGTSLGAVPGVIEISGWTTFSPFIFNFFWSQIDDPSIVYGWIREEANIMEGYVYGVRCGAVSDSDCYDLRAGAAEMSNPIPKSQPYRTVWLYRLE
jgi:hypothetical protein